jgi:hypothetical protein
MYYDNFYLSKVIPMILKPALASLAALSLAACASVVPSGAARLSSVSPVTTDPADFAVLLQLPPGLAVRPGSPQMALSATRTDTGETSTATYVLEASPPDEAGNRTYRVAPGDYASLRAQQSLIALWKSENERATSGSLSVGLEGCSLGAGPAPNATVSALVQAAPNQPFIQVLRDVSVAEIARAAGMEEIRPCS